MINISRYFCDRYNSFLFLCITYFTYGIILSPFSFGFALLIVSFIIYEIFFYIYTRGNLLFWNPRQRGFLFILTILSWIIGRTLSGDNILEDGINFF